VIPEIDIPGHAYSWRVGQPQLGMREGESFACVFLFDRHQFLLAFPT
jgi:hypothetical protein